jgi:DNA-binding NtrC family response regulator
MSKWVVAVATGHVSSAQHWGRVLAAHGFEVAARTDLTEIQDLVRTQRLDAAIIAVPPASAERVLSHVSAWRQARLSVGVVLVVSESSESLVLAALRAGVSDVLREPISVDELLMSVDRLLRSRRVDVDQRDGAAAAWSSVEPMVGQSLAMKEVRSYVERVALTDSNVLITGETGVGKELIAGMIHATSPRRRKPCVSINCAAIPDALLESELFGFERGAFTGADRAREGSLKSADGGSVFFDEIGDMGITAQAKILRAIEAREVHRLGGGRSVPLDIRVIAATNQDLESLVEGGRFRKDLFYRLNVARIHLPPLRERLDDLQHLLRFYIDHFNRRFGRHVQGLTPGALECLGRHDWPGNIRELKNLLEAIFVNLDRQHVDYIEVPESFRSRLARASEVSASERQRLVNALFAARWNKSKAAEELNWSRMTLYRKLAKYHIVRESTPTRKRS